MVVTLTAKQLKEHMPKLCKRLNAQALFVSLLGELGDSDQNIVRKKIEKSCWESDGMIISYMYEVLIRTLDEGHVDCFLRAVQEQFEDLGELGIKIEAPENKEKVARLPRHEQPDATHAATGSRPCQERAAHSSEPTTERCTPYPSTSDGSVRSGNPSVTEVAEANNVGNAALPCARNHLNILTSVEDNTANGTASTDEVEGGEGSSPLAANPSDLTNRPGRKIGTQPGPTPDAFNHGNVQTDGELPTHDLQPEQPEDLVENSEDDQWASDAPQSTTSPMRAVVETARPTTVIYNIAKLIVPGKGNYVGLGGDMIIKTMHKPPRQQQEYTPHRGREEECPALPQAVSSSIVDQSEDTTAKLPITYLDPNDPRHCQQIAQSVESLCLPDLSIFRSSDSHHNTKPKVTTENQAEKVVTTSNFNESNESSKPSQIQDQEIGTEQNPNQLTCGFSKPGILLGPMELQMLEERNASIEIPSGVVLSPEASRSS